MKVHIRSTLGVDKTLNVYRKIIDCEGWYIAEDTNGVVFSQKNGEPIKFNIAHRTGIGYLENIEFTYLVEGYLND